jgi:hypothetical protein
VTTPLLSIVTPTLGRFTDAWLRHYLALRGDVEFVLVYPLDVEPHPLSDPRVRVLRSPFRGELMQRLVGLAQTRGQYVLALDDDDVLHPDIATLTTPYFARFPESWVLRLRLEREPAERATTEPPWTALPDAATLPVVPPDAAGAYEDARVLRTVPICPLDARVDWRLLACPFGKVERRDMHGPHMENFNNRIWRGDLVRGVLPDVIRSMRVVGALRWIPATGFDRVLSLFIQARHFRPGLVIGHWLPAPAQVRVLVKPSAQRYVRFHAASHALLVKAYPRSGYLWNLLFSTLHGIPSGGVDVLRRRTRARIDQASTTGNDPR